MAMMTFSEIQNQGWSMLNELLAYDHEERGGEPLSDWEVQFIEDLNARRGRGRMILTGKQINKLEQIWEKALGPV